MRNWIVNPSLFVASMVTMLNFTWAGNPWASAIGEARVAQHRAEDIANRIKRTAPHNPLVRHAMAVDQLACALIERVKCGAPCSQVESLYGQLERSWRHLRLAIYTDECLCADRSLKSLADGMDTRMRNLCKALERVIEREFRCAPTIRFGATEPYALYGPSWNHPSWPNPAFGGPRPRRAF